MFTEVISSLVSLANTASAEGPSFIQEKGSEIDINRNRGLPTRSIQMDRKNNG